MSFYFDKDTKVESKEVITKAEIGNTLFTFITDNNVFSKNTITSNTVMLGGAAIAIEDVAAQSGTEIAGFMLTNNKYIEEEIYE